MSQKNPGSYNVPEQPCQNRPIINDFQQRGSLFINLLIVDEKFHRGGGSRTTFAVSIEIVAPLEASAPADHARSTMDSCFRKH